MPIKNLLTKPIETMLAQAAAAELYAAHLYQHIGNQMQFQGWFGAQKFFLAESASERGHYQRLVDFANQRGSWLPVPAVPAIDETVGSLGDALQVAYDTEVQLGQDYEAWHEECRCPTARQFLLSYLEEQRTSVGEIGDLISRLERCGADKGAMLTFDRELSA